MQVKHGLADSAQHLLQHDFILILMQMETIENLEDDYATAFILLVNIIPCGHLIGVQVKHGLADSAQHLLQHRLDVDAKTDLGESPGTVGVGCCM